MPSPTSYLLLNPSKPSSFRWLSAPAPRLHARRFHVSCDAPRGSSGRSGGGRREAIPAGASKAKKQIVFFDAAPPVSQEGGAAVEKAGGEKPTTKVGSGGNAALALLRRATKRTLAVLSNLPLAISEMFAIAALMALGPD
jgi:cytochrome c biogenesis protein